MKKLQLNQGQRDWICVVIAGQIIVIMPRRVNEYNAKVSGGQLFARRLECLVMRGFYMINDEGIDYIIHNETQ